MLRNAFGILVAVGCLVGVASVARAQTNLIVDNTTVTLSGVRRYDHVCVINGGVVRVAPYIGGSKTATGNLELIARSILVDETSRIDARGAGYQTTRCSDGTGPTAIAGGRGGCSVRDSGGGGAHFGAGGRGTIDDPTVFPRDYEDDCMHVSSGTACDDDADCGNPGPTVAGQTFWHNIYQPEFGGSGGDKGCRDGDGFGSAPMVGGAGGGRVVLVGLTERGTGTSPCGAAAGSVVIDGTVDSKGKRGCGIQNDSGGGGAGGTVLIVGGHVSVGSTAVVTVAGALGGDTRAADTMQPDYTDCPVGAQTSGTCDDCGGGGGGGIISVLSVSSDLDPFAKFLVGGAVGGTCSVCQGEAGGGAGELQLDGAYVGEFCDGFDNNFDGMIDEGLTGRSCGVGPCAQNLSACAAGTPPICTPTLNTGGGGTNPSCLAPLVDTRPRVSVILDTSASMLLDLAGDPTFGDGTTGQPSRTGADQSRMFLAREALAQVMSAYPEIDFSLARYHQDQGIARSCQSAAWFECQGLIATYDDPTNNTGVNACTNLPVSLAGAGTTPITVATDPNGDECINYAGSCGPPRRGADILTGFGMPTNHIVRWLDGRETNTTNIDVVTPGDVCRHSSGGDCEVRGTGPTPLAGSLLAIQDYVVPIRATDPVRNTGVCRSYSVILVTDGAESCNGVPQTAAAQLFNLSPAVQVYVIAVSVKDTEQAELNAIARSGSGNARDATFVTAPEQLVPALTSIIADSLRSELCNGLDDDCDGEIDEDFPGLGGACANTGLGICRGTGTVQCTGDQRGTQCVITTPGMPSTAETCNGLDDDCDGNVDDQLQRDCDRGCGTGTEFCIAGDWVGCGAPSPQTEICNGLDDDCDGEIDEASSGVPLTRPCATACGAGIETCKDGAFEDCDALSPSPEICNNIDDNCNGVIDDGNPEGGERCLPRDDGSFEVLSGGNAGASADVCTPGTVTCSAGELKCVGASSSSAEICNCKDDNCNGEIDEKTDGALCPGQAQCIDCRCVSPCVDSEFAPCPPGRACDTSFADPAIDLIGLCVPGKCADVTCPETSVCDPLSGECNDLCKDVSCDGGTTCVRGRCVENTCYGLGCADGEICRGECVADPCEDADCAGAEFCRDGKCIGACERCAAGKVCSDGKCVANPCADGCTDEQACIDGKCVRNECEVSCGTGRLCRGNDCVHDPCFEVSDCPEGTQCLAVDRAGELIAQCSTGSDPGKLVEPVEPDNVLVTGGGGCTCSVPGTSTTVPTLPNSRGALALSFVALGFLWRVRRRRLGGGPRGLARVRGLLFFLSLLGISGGCTVNPFCVSNCPEDDDAIHGTGGSSGASGGGSGGSSGNGGEGGMSPLPVVDGCVPAEEFCNAVDDDCDGLVDETFELKTDPAHCGACDQACMLPQAFARCRAAECEVDHCEVGYHDRDHNVINGCEYQCTESGAEVCDLLDNDCDEAIDEETDQTTDIANCGKCGSVCDFPNAAASCDKSQCVMGACITGFVDVNAKAADGCEVRCTASAELCNAVDDDCDGEIDEDVSAPSGLCRTTPGTPCANVEAVCDARAAGTTWYCDYPASVDFVAGVPNGISNGESRCDGIDNDCNGDVDDTFADLGAPCNDGETGICRGTGTVQCLTETTVGCVITDPGATALGAELCNGRDDNCNGMIDEGSIDDVVHITHSGMNYYIYRYEASRPDAANDVQGISATRACSKPGVLPWTVVSRQAAQAACVAANMRLCNRNEWRTACEGVSNRAYPYLGAYAAAACNGADYGTTQGSQRLRTTGAQVTCTSSDGLLDMSGNAKEWTSYQPDALEDLYVVRGGSYQSPELGLGCLTELSQAASGTLLDGIGFRCCSTNAP